MTCLGHLRTLTSIALAILFFLQSVGQGAEILPLDPEGVDEGFILELIHKNEEDSLLRITELFLELAKKDRKDLLAEAYYFRSMAMTYVFDYANVIDLCKQGIGLAQDKSDILLRFRKTLANAYKYDGHLDSARSQLQLILDTGSAVDSSLLAEAYFTMYTIYTMESNDEEGLNCLYRSLELFEGIGDFSFASSIKSYIGVIYHGLDDDSMALAYQDEALDYFLEHDELDNASFVYLERGNMYLDMERYEDAASDLSEVVEISTLTGHLGNKANGLNLLGNVYARMGDDEKAIDHYHRSMSICREYEILFGIVSCDLDLSTIYLELEQFDSALFYAKEMNEISEREEFTDYETQAKRILSDAYASIGDFKSAYRTKIAEYQLRDSVFNLEKTTAIGELREKFEREKNLRELAELKSKAELDRVKRNGLLLGLLLVVLLASVIINREFNRRKKARELHLTQLKLAETERVRLKEQLEFRNRELTSNALSMARKNEFINTMTERLNDIGLSNNVQNEIRGLKSDLKVEGQLESSWEQFTTLFAETNPDFYKVLTTEFPGLSKGELRMAALVRMNLGNKDIARLLNISDEGVKKARYRLRKKLELGPEKSLEAKLLSL